MDGTARGLAGPAPSSRLANHVGHVLQLIEVRRLQWGLFMCAFAVYALPENTATVVVRSAAASPSLALSTTAAKRSEPITTSNIPAKQTTQTAPEVPAVSDRTPTVDDTEQPGLPSPTRLATLTLDGHSAVTPTVTLPLSASVTEVIAPPPAKNEIPEDVQVATTAGAATSAAFSAASPSMASHAGRMESVNRMRLCDADALSVPPPRITNPLGIEIPVEPSRYPASEDDVDAHREALAQHAGAIVGNIVLVAAAAVVGPLVAVWRMLSRDTDFTEALQWTWWPGYTASLLAYFVMPVAQSAMELFKFGYASPAALTVALIGTFAAIAPPVAMVWYWNTTASWALKWKPATQESSLGTAKTDATKPKKAKKKDRSNQSALLAANNDHDDDGSDHQQTQNDDAGGRANIKDLPAACLSAIKGLFVDDGEWIVRKKYRLPKCKKDAASSSGDDSASLMSDSDASQASRGRKKKKKQQRRKRKKQRRHRNVFYFGFSQMMIAAYRVKVFFAAELAVNALIGVATGLQGTVLPCVVVAWSVAMLFGVLGLLFIILRPSPRRFDDGLQVLLALGQCAASCVITAVQSGWMTEDSEQRANQANNIIALLTALLLIVGPAMSVAALITNACRKRSQRRAERERRRLEKERRRKRRAERLAELRAERDRGKRFRPSMKNFDREADVGVDETDSESTLTLSDSDGAFGHKRRGPPVRIRRGTQVVKSVDLANHASLGVASALGLAGRDSTFFVVDLERRQYSERRAASGDALQQKVRHMSDSHSPTHGTEQTVRPWMAQDVGSRARVRAKGRWVDSSDSTSTSSSTSSASRSASPEPTMPSSALWAAFLSGGGARQDGAEPDDDAVVATRPHNHGGSSVAAAAAPRTALPRADNQSPHSRSRGATHDAFDEDDSDHATRGHAVLVPTPAEHRINATAFEHHDAQRPDDDPGTVEQMVAALPLRAARPNPQLATTAFEPESGPLDVCGIPLPSHAMFTPGLETPLFSASESAVADAPFGPPVHVDVPVPAKPRSRPQRERPVAFDPDYDDEVAGVRLPTSFSVHRGGLSSNERAEL